MNKSTSKNSKFSVGQAIQLVGLVSVLVSIALGVSQLKIVRQFFSQAAKTPADITVRTQTVLGPLPRPWRNLAQGGESHNWQLKPLAEPVRALRPEYIRLDHIYDFYDVVSGSPGNLQFNFDQLDVVITDILAVGAKPFISLSYMPPVIAQNGDIVSPPVRMEDWSLVVQKTIEHLSGTRNIPDVYYEVWNEPDLFGGYKYYGNRNYLNLYEAAANGAARARVRQNYKFGGPAITALYKNWFDAFLQFAQEKDLRVDFFSWHRYATDLNQYQKDMDEARGWLRSYPRYESTLELLITEWGHDSDNNAGYDNAYGAAHTVAGAISMVGTIQRAFVFEIQDGRDPNQQSLWGRWGLFTAPEAGGNAKPRYNGLKQLDALPNQRLQLSGTTDFIKALAGLTDAGATQVVLANFDPDQRNVEAVPVTFTEIAPGNYQVSQRYLSGKQTKETVATSAAALRTLVRLGVNDVATVELKPLP